MNKQAPNLPRILTMVVFALSCFGLLLFLWISFGGATPLKPKGYRVVIPFEQAGNLVSQVDVRISGVPVGKVVKLDGTRDRTLATVQINPRYAPLPSDVRATLRQKTLLGETYIELTPGTPRAPKLKEGGRLAQGNVQGQVELDQIFQSFDARTRADLGTWLQQWGRAVDGRGEDVSGAVGGLPVLTDRAAGVLGIMDRQSDAVRRLVADGSTVFGITARRGDALRTIVDQGDRVLAATAALPRQVRGTVRELPAVLTSLKALLPEQRRLFAALDPGARTLLPVAGDVKPTLTAAERLSPQLPALAAALRTVNRAAPSGLPAISKLLKAARPALTQLDPVAGALTPIVDYINLYRREIVSSFANVAAASQETAPSIGGGSQHVIRILPPEDESLFLGVPTKSPNARTNAYVAPGGIDLNNLKAFSCKNTSNPPGLPLLGTTPRCVEQGPVPVDGKSTDFPQLEPRVLKAAAK
jgi:phospholipid/cholesterol/gamma-HCH transport system substrate-binding protein